MLNSLLAIHTHEAGGVATTRQDNYTEKLESVRRTTSMTEAKLRHSELLDLAWERYDCVAGITTWFAEVVCGWGVL